MKRSKANRNMNSNENMNKTNNDATHMEASKMGKTSTMKRSKNSNMNNCK